MPGPRTANYKPDYAKIKRQNEAVKDFPARVVRGAKAVGSAVAKGLNIGRENYIKAGRYGPRGMMKMSEEEAGKKWDMRKVKGAMRNTFK